MTDLKNEAFAGISPEDLNAFLKAHQNELALTDAGVQTFLEMKIDGYLFVHLTEETLETKLHVRELAARKRIWMLIEGFQYLAAMYAIQTVADFLIEDPSLMSVDKRTTNAFTKPKSPRWPAIVSEWNFVKDVLLWKEKYRHSLSRLVPKFVFHPERMLPCTQEVPDAHRWWCEMVATPLNCVLPNGIKAKMAPLEADLYPDFGFIDDKRVKLVGEIKNPWHPLARGPATAPDFMIKTSPVYMALGQLYGYMNNNFCQYGVLTTYTYTWFVKRTAVMSELLISPPISYNSKLPSLFECYYFLICEMEQSGFYHDKSAENSAPVSKASSKSATPEGSRPGTPTRSLFSRLTTQNYSSDEYDPTH